MKVRFIGATGTVTGSRFRIEHGATAGLIDCGLFQGPKTVRQKNWEEPEGVRALSGVILTHAHVDHCGLLPLLPKRGFRGPIYCSRATADLCRVILPDAGKLQEEDARFLNDRKLSHFEPALPLYTEEDAKRVLELLETVEDDVWIPFGGEMKFRLSRSGHILGSRFVEVGNHHRVLFSGDVGQPDPLLLKEPVRFSETDFLILESTYGNRGHERVDRKAQLGAVVQKVIGRGGTLIIPAFSVGRAQDLLYLLAQLERETTIPAVPVYLDSPMALDATELYLKHENELKPELFEGGLRSPLRSVNFRSVRDADESMLLCMDTSPKIVISAAGMLNGGRVLHHLKTKLPDPLSGVLFVGYQVPGSKGELLRNGIGRLRIHRQVIDVEAEIFKMSSLSAHADSDQLVDWCRGFRTPPRKTFLVHGEDPAREALAYRLRTELGWQVGIPREGETFEFPYS